MTTTPQRGRPAIDTPHTHTHLLAWLAARPLLSLRAIEQHLSMPATQLHKAVAGTRGLPAKYYTPLATLLRRYGYRPKRKPVIVDMDFPHPQVEGPNDYWTLEPVKDKIEKISKGTLMAWDSKEKKAKPIRKTSKALKS